jgi:hypothetical protein
MYVEEKSRSEATDFENRRKINFQKNCATLHQFYFQENVKLCKWVREIEFNGL